MFTLIKIILITYLLGLNSAWSQQCRSLLNESPYNKAKLILTNADINTHFNNGATLFLNNSRTEFSGDVKITPLKSATTDELIEVTLSDGRTYVFKEWIPILPYHKFETEFRILKAIELTSDLGLEVHYINRNGSILIGTRKADGINIKELYRSRRWRNPGLKEKIEKMLNKKFESEDDSVFEMVNLLIKNIIMHEKLDELSALFLKLGVEPGDFQAMIFYDNNSSSFSLKLIDAGEYRIQKPDENYPVDVLASVLRELNRSIQKGFIN